MKTATCALLELVISVFEVSRRACEEAERQGKCVLALLRSQEIGSAAFAGLFVSATHFLRGLHISGDPQFWRLTTEPATDRKNQGSGGVIPPEPCAFSSCLCRCILCSDLLLHPPNQLSQLRLTFRLGEGVDLTQPQAGDQLGVEEVLPGRGLFYGGQKGIQLFLIQDGHRLVGHLGRFYTVSRIVR